jgi:hypothetical protein
MTTRPRLNAHRVPNQSFRICWCCTGLNSVILLKCITFLQYGSSDRASFNSSRDSARAIKTPAHCHHRPIHPYDKMPAHWIGTVYVKYFTQSVTEWELNSKKFLPKIGSKRRSHAITVSSLAAEPVLSKSARPHFATKCDDRQDRQHKRCIQKYGTQSR